MCTIKLLENATALVSKGDFYIRGFVLWNFIEAVSCMLHGLYLHCIRRTITLGGYLDTRIWKHLEYLRNNILPEIYIQ